MPLRLSRPVARQGKLITVQLEARQSSPQRVQGLVMLYYPAHLVSLAALHSPTGETAVAFPASPRARPPQPTRRLPISSCGRPGPPGSLVSSAGP